LADHAVGRPGSGNPVAGAQISMLNADCPPRIFAEQVDGLTQRDQRRSPLLTKVGLALAAERRSG
jgi:hypothetical protein